MQLLKLISTSKNLKDRTKKTNTKIKNSDIELKPTKNSEEIPQENGNKKKVLNVTMFQSDKSVLSSRNIELINDNQESEF